jgi:Domain of unknown function (DUF4105)
MIARTGRRLAIAFVLLATAWGALALWFDGSTSQLIAEGLAAGFVAICIGMVTLVRPLYRGVLLALVPIAAVAFWWISIAPSNLRDWSPDVARLAHATFDGNRVTIENVRDFKYHSETDYDARWETRTYDLDKIRGVDMFLSYWGPTLIAHTIASWEFDDGRHLAISIETRKQTGESYSALRGFFRQYELVYVVADERDLIGLRTNFRGERVCLYHLQVPATQARTLLIDYLRQLNRLAMHSQWYNALTSNCTTMIRYHAQNVGARNPLDWRILANGRVDELLYERGQIDTSLPFAELRKRSNITARAKAAGDSANFSARIRENLPGSESAGAKILH